MTDYISDPPSSIEKTSEYVVTRLNEFIEEVSEGTVVIDRIQEPTTARYLVHVVVRFEETEPYELTEPDFSSDMSINEGGEKLCVFLENDEYLHIFSTTKDWSSFDEREVFGICLDMILRASD